MHDASDTTTLSFCVRGRVQGVWFRGWTRDQATARGLTGWVRNEPNGTVTGLLHGPAEAVTGRVEALKDGPPSAQVDRVETAPAPPHEDTGFVIRR